MLEIMFVLGGMALVFASIYFMSKGVNSANAKRRVLSHVAMFTGVFALTLVLSTSHVFAEDGITGTLAQGLGFIAAALVTGCSCIGAGIAVAAAAPAAIGAISENSDNFGKAMIFVALGGGVAIYGLLISILLINSL